MLTFSLVQMIIIWWCIFIYLSSQVDCEHLEIKARNLSFAVFNYDLAFENGE